MSSTAPIPSFLTRHVSSPVVIVEQGNTTNTPATHSCTTTQVATKTYNDDDNDDDDDDLGGGTFCIGLVRSLSSTMSLSDRNNNSTDNNNRPSSSSSSSLKRRSKLGQSLQRLNSSSRLSLTCNGSELSQLYLSGPETDTMDLLHRNSSLSSSSSRSRRGGTIGSTGRSGGSRGGGMSSAKSWSSTNSSWGNTSFNSSASNGSNTHVPSSSSLSSSSESWMEAADFYARRTSFSRRRSSYARFLDMDIMSEIAESEHGGSSGDFTNMTGNDNSNNNNSNNNNNNIAREKEMLIEESYGEFSDAEVIICKQKLTTRNKLLKTIQWIHSCYYGCCHSPLLVVPAMMAMDLVLGVSLSLYDSNLLRNVPGFHFPLCYAWTQKFTNAVASLVLILLSRRQEREERREERKIMEMMSLKRHGKMMSLTGNGNSTALMMEECEQDLMELPSMQTFRKHMIPLTGIALVQTISSAFANQALQIIPLPLFKVVLMCGPIFVAFLTSMMEGQRYSRGRLIALSFIVMGACRAVYAEAGVADNPRVIMVGAGYALGACAFSGIGLVLSSALMHGNHVEEEEEEDTIAAMHSSGSSSAAIAADVGGRMGVEGQEEMEKLLEGTTTSNKPTEQHTAIGVEEELNPLSLLFYLSCEQVLMLSLFLCPWEELGTSMEELFTQDEPEEFISFLIYFADDPWTTILYLMTGSMMALCLAVLTFVLVNRTSPVAASLLGNVRSIATVAISSLVFEGVVKRGDEGGGSGNGVLGYSLTLAGGVMYALAALRRDDSSS